MQRKLTNGVLSLHQKLYTIKQCDWALYDTYTVHCTHTKVQTQNYLICALLRYITTNNIQLIDVCSAV